MSEIKLLCSNTNRELAEKIAKVVKVKLTELEVKTFSDAETYVSIKETVRGDDVFIIQPASGNTNGDIIEYLLIIDAVRRSSGRSITAVIPYFFYGRQEKQMGPREPISAKLYANLLSVAGVDRVVTVNLHSGTIQGFFDIPVEHLTMIPKLADYFKKMRLPDPVVVSPDAGGAKRARFMAKLLEAPLVVIDKRRERHNQVAEMFVIGEVAGKTAIIVDDIIDTAGTVTEAAEVLKTKGAKDIYIAAVHPVMSGPAYDRVNGSAVKELVVCDSIPVDMARSKKIRRVSMAPTIGEAIRRIYENKALTDMYKVMI
ncbi:MAG: ribose-phosphate pyrophosphokinase [archaeon]